MSANLSCYSKKYDRPRIEKIKSIIDDVKASIGFQTTSLAGLSELAQAQLAKINVANDVVVKDAIKDIDGCGLAANSHDPNSPNSPNSLSNSHDPNSPNSPNSLSNLHDPSDPSNLVLSPAASEAQEQANKTSIEAGKSSIVTDSTSANSVKAKREKSPYVLAIGEISYQLCYGENYIGRDESNQIVIENNHISRLHALVVVHSNNKVAIFDLGSLNGTFVNGRLIKCAALEVEDKVRLGSYCQLTLSVSLTVFGTVIKVKLKGQQIADSSLEQLNQSADGVINNDDQDNFSLIN